ncbi:histidine phosphatase family protein [Alcaligenaceae bacterium C4P045]|nr:histidine phosphatase family protein [Alcaligenaceae bacterium C4P045]
MTPAHARTHRASCRGSRVRSSVTARLARVALGAFSVLAASAFLHTPSVIGTAQAASVVTMPGTPAAPAAGPSPAVTPAVPPSVTPTVKPNAASDAAPGASPSNGRIAAPLSASPGTLPSTPSGVATLADLAKRNVLVIIRHANAPGVGDPAGYNLDDCSTQRNLDDKGREQAAAIGRAWKQAGIFPTRVWTSAWCRCIETAQRMELGPVALLPQLNSSFEDAGSRARQTDALFQFIKGLKPNGGPYLMVTHQVNISAISNDWVETGAGVVLDLKPDGTWTMRKLAQ